MKVEDLTKYIEEYSKIDYDEWDEYDEIPDDEYLKIRYIKQFTKYNEISDLFLYINRKISLSYETISYDTIILNLKKYQNNINIEMNQYINSILFIDEILISDTLCYYIYLLYLLINFNGSRIYIDLSRYNYISKCINPAYLNLISIDYHDIYSILNFIEDSLELFFSLKSEYCI